MLEIISKLTSCGYDLNGLDEIVYGQVGQYLPGDCDSCTQSCRVACSVSGKEKA
jgi:hypothetical protein